MQQRAEIERVLRESGSIVVADSWPGEREPLERTLVGFEQTFDPVSTACEYKRRRLPSGCYTLGAMRITRENKPLDIKISNGEQASERTHRPRTRLAPNLKIFRIQSFELI
jgi:hypothetical protein